MVKISLVKFAHSIALFNSSYFPLLNTSNVPRLVSMSRIQALIVNVFLGLKLGRNNTSPGRNNTSPLFMVTFVIPIYLIKVLVLKTTSLTPLMKLGLLQFLTSFF